MSFTFIVPGIVAIGSGIAAGVAAIGTAVAALGTAVAGAVGVTATGALATAIGAGTISGTVTAIKGGSVEDVLKSAVIGGTTSYFGGTIASEIAGSVTMSGATLAADLGYANLASSLFSTSEQIIKSALTSSFGAVLTGDDPVDALIKGGLAGGVSSAVSSTVDSVLEDIPGLDEIRGNQVSSAVERALKTSIANSIVSGEDFDQSFINSLTSSGASYLFDTVESTFNDFSKDLLEDSELAKRSKEQVDGLINREEDLVTTINSYIPEVQNIANSIEDNVDTQNYWAGQANSFIPTLKDLGSRANSVTAMVNEMNGEYGFNHWAVQKAPDRFLTDRAGGTYGNYEFTTYLVELGEWDTYTKVVVVNKDTGARLYSSQELINDVNANAEYINNTFPSVKDQYDGAINNLNNAKAEYSNLTDSYNNAKNTLDGYVNELNQVRNDYDAEVKELNSNVTDYQNTLQNFVKAEAENTQKINKLVSDLPQVVSSYEADYGVKPTDQQLADLYIQGDRDISTGYDRFDFNNVSEKEAEAFLGELGYTPTEEEVKKFVGQVNEDATKADIAGYVDLVNTDYAEAESFLKGLGYTPTEDEIKQFVGKVNEDAARANIAGYVDPRQVTEAEAREFLEANGYTPTEDEIKQFVGQVNEDATKANIAAYVNPRQVTEAEAKSFLRGLGYTPTDAEIKKFVGQVNEDATKADIAKYVDPRQVTEAEAREFLEANGYRPTNAEIKKFVGQVNEDAAKTNIASYVDPRQVTEAEVREFLEANGYTPTDAEVRYFVGQVNEKAAEEIITSYVDPRQVTEAEARQVLTDLGVDPESEYGKDLIAEYTRQGDETQLIDQLTAGADSFIRTPKTVGDLLKLATNPVAYVLSPISGEVSKLVTGTINNAIGADNLDTQTKALIKTASAAVVNGAFAELLGGDFKKAALGTVVGTALNALPIPGTKDLFEGAKNDLTFNQIVDRISTSALSAAGLDVDSKFGTRIVDGTNSAIRAGLIAYVAGGNEKQILINTGTAFLGGAFGNTKLSKDVSKKLDTFGNELTEDAFDENGILKGLDPVDKIVVQGKSDTDTGIEEATGIIGGLALMKRFTKDDVAPVSGGSGQGTVGGGGSAGTVTITATRESCAAEGKKFDETTNQCVDLVDVIGDKSGQGTVGGGGSTNLGSVTATACGPGKTRDPETGLCLETVEEDEECPPGQVDTGFGCQDITAGPCDPGFHDENGLCVADTDEKPPECSEGEVRNLNTGLCEAVQPDPCPAGYKRNAAGECEIQVQYQPLPSFFGIEDILKDRGDGAGYSPNLREKFTAVRTYTPPPEDYDYFKDDYFQRFGPISYVPPENYAGDGKAEGGLMSLAKGGRTSLPPRYLDGHSDGMADKVPASIDNSRPAALSDGEFVIPADVVSHLGNGNSNAGAKVLYEMMDRIRRARTGNSKQGKQINPSKFIPR